MAFELVAQETVVKGESSYVLRLLFDSDTNRQKNEYWLNGELLYFMEFDAVTVDEPMNDLDIQSLVSGFDYWFSIVGPDWRPEAF